VGRGQEVRHGEIDAVLLRDRIGALRRGEAELLRADHVRLDAVEDDFAIDARLRRQRGGIDRGDERLCLAVACQILGDGGVTVVTQHVAQIGILAGIEPQRRGEFRRLANGFAQDLIEGRVQPSVARRWCRCCSR
jgi:hypothetical protein